MNQASITSWSLYRRVARAEGHTTCKKPLPLILKGSLLEPVEGCLTCLVAWHSGRTSVFGGQTSLSCALPVADG